MLLGADEHVSVTRNREYFFQYIPRGVAEVSIKDATHEDAQFPAEVPPLTPRSIAGNFRQRTDIGAFSLAATGGFDYAWSSFSDALRSGKFMNARKK
jgi:hypothetical protein